MVATSSLERRVFATTAAALSRLFLFKCTNLNVLDIEHLHTAINSSRPLITIANHDSTMDDPLLFGLLNPLFFWNNIDRVRWTLGAQDICFTNRIYSRFFSSGQIIPIVRGYGVHQFGVDYAIKKLNENGWVHLFPEGKVNVQKEIMRFKWGVARLIMESNTPPIVLTIYHRGMGEILPLNDYKSGLRRGKDLNISFGEIIDFRTFQNLKSLDSNSPDHRKLIADFLQASFSDLVRKSELKFEELKKSR
jgi:monolysocardiolipin acyltransferase